MISNVSMFVESQKIRSTRVFFKISIINARGRSMEFFLFFRCFIAASCELMNKIWKRSRTIIDFIRRKSHWTLRKTTSNEKKRKKILNSFHFTHTHTVFFSFPWWRKVLVDILSVFFFFFLSNRHEQKKSLIEIFSMIIIIRSTIVFRLPLAILMPIKSSIFSVERPTVKRFAWCSTMIDRHASSNNVERKFQRDKFSIWLPQISTPIVV